MRLIESGRFVFPADAHVARRFSEENLLSIHSRAARLRAIAFGARVRGIEREAEPDEVVRRVTSSREWLLFRGAGTIVFVFDRELRSVVKVGAMECGSAQLPLSTATESPLRGDWKAVAGRYRTPNQREAEMLGALDMAEAPRVVEYRGGMLTLSPVKGQPLWISMQRSLRPSLAHAAHLANAGRWLGRFHAATRDGDAVAVHGDFWARNLLFTATRVSGVVDWEHGALRGEPWKDLFTLPLHAPSWSRPEREVDADVVDEYFRAYIAEAGGTLRAVRERFDEWRKTSVSSG